MGIGLSALCDPRRHEAEEVTNGIISEVFTAKHVRVKKNKNNKKKFCNVGGIWLDVNVVIVSENAL